LSILVELEFGDIGFCGGRKKTREPREKPSQQGENQQGTQPTCGTGPESNTGHIGGGAGGGRGRGRWSECSYHCAIPSPQ